MIKNKTNYQLAMGNNAKRVAEIKADIRRMIAERRNTIEQAERDLQTLLQTDAILFEYNDYLTLQADK